jgi:hypothetical protein
MSTVHVNRSIKQLRQDRLIAFDGTTLEVLDWDRLKAVGDFEPSYRHIGNGSLPGEHNGAV